MIRTFNQKCLLKQPELALFWRKTVLLLVGCDWENECDIILADEIMQLKRECAELRQRVHDVEMQMQM